MPNPPRLTLDRRIPIIALILLGVTCACSGVGAAVQVGAMKARFDELSAKQAQQADDHDTLIEVKTDLKSVKASVDRIEAHQRGDRR